MTTRRPFRLGAMMRIPVVNEHGVRDPQGLFQQGLEVATALEELGFESLWVTQHHFGSVDSAMPSPLVFLAAAAARTTRIRLGTTVVTAALEDPLRLAEDAASVDAISGGRLELGLGATSDRIERDAFGVEAAEQRAIVHRTAIRLRETFRGAPVDDIPEAIVEPRVPALASRIWLATITRAHAEFAGQHGFGLITNYRPSDLEPANRDYPAAYANVCRGCGATPRIAMSRGIYPVDDVAAARAALMPQARRFAERGRTFGWLPSTFEADQFFDREDFHFGRPEDVIRKLSNDPGLDCADILLTGLLSMRVTPRELLPVLERVARDVAPALGWRPSHERATA